MQKGRDDDGLWIDIIDVLFVPLNYNGSLGSVNRRQTPGSQPVQEILNNCKTRWDLGRSKSMSNLYVKTVIPVD
jgi:hypothetical protein